MLKRRSALLILVFGLAYCTSNNQAAAPLTLCPDEQVAQALATVGEYVHTQGAFVSLQGGKFVVDGAPYTIEGVNYYPSRYPWRRFLTETDSATLDQELSLMQETGFNTLRIFLWNEALFDCEGNGAVPNVDVFQRVDTIIQKAASYNFRLIVTLNDLPDLDNYPLYDNPSHIQLQTAFIINRYVNEPAILAWDVRNEGDIDYGTHHAIPAKATKDQVIKWLAATTQAIRQLDTNHLLTAGWLYTAELTAPYVDFISFHHWTSADELVSRVNALRQFTDKPILLQEFGYSTGRVSPEEQATLMLQVIQTSEAQQLLGWMIWTAFDFPIDRSCYPSPCQSPNNGEHYFGIWTIDTMPKPAYFALMSRQ